MFYLGFFFALSLATCTFCAVSFNGIDNGEYVWNLNKAMETNEISQCIQFYIAI
jgi:ABC-type transporter Mla maintaining outer membrane lipid asymmetry permease subunit MlaE